MHSNPFSPSFSIRPERFFGRDKELDTMRGAIANPDSPQRFLFLTGTRGCGKTSLLHQFARIAEAEAGWTAIEATYQDCVERLGDYAGTRARRTKSLTVEPSVSVAGASVSALSVARESTESPERHLAHAFVRKASKERRGILILIDEVQKIAESDMEEVCHAVQSAKTAGADVALVIAGLPAAYAKIRRYPGCTFIQRMRRHKLGLLSVADTLGFLRAMFGLVPELSVDDGALQEIAEFSGGHPYLLQLLGSYACDLAQEQGIPHPAAVVALDGSTLREAERRALADYQENVLANLLIGLRPGSREYLRALCNVSDDRSTARTADVAAALGKTLQECSSQRARMIDLQLALPVGRGLLRLALPYLPLAFDSSPYEPDVDTSDMWVPRKTPFE